MEYGDLEVNDFPQIPPGWSAWLVGVSWLNPYREPPEGWPRKLVEALIPVPPGKGCPPTPPDILALHRQLGLGSGWVISVCMVPRPIKHWSDERRFKYRLSRLELRIRRKYPMFAEQFIEEAKRRKPEYYGVPRAQARGLAAA